MSFCEVWAECTQSVHCCGIALWGGFEEGYASMWSDKSPKEFKTAEGRNKALYAEFLKQMKRDTTSHNHYAASAKKIKCCYGMATCSLIKEYCDDGEDDLTGKEQIEGLIQFLLDKGWVIDVEFVNPKTGNTVVNMSIKL